MAEGIYWVVWRAGVARRTPVPRSKAMLDPDRRTVEVRPSRFGRSVHAARTFRQGEVVLRGWGEQVPLRTRHSFQVDFDTHVEIRSEIEIINHSCDPNCGVLLRRGVPLMEIVARRRIERGEELTTDYASFEYHIEFMPDPCLCGSARCRGRVTGYRDLPPSRRAEYGRFIAEYLPALEAALPHAGAGREAEIVPVGPGAGRSRGTEPRVRPTPQPAEGRAAPAPTASPATPPSGKSASPPAAAERPAAAAP